MYGFIYLLILVGFGFWGMYMAKNRRRSEVTGFVLGFLFTWMALVGYLIAGDSQELADEKMVEREKRIEKLRKEK